MSNKNPTYEELLAENDTLLEINGELGADCYELSEIVEENERVNKVRSAIGTLGVLGIVCVTFSYIVGFAATGANTVIGVGLVDYGGAMAIQLLFGIAVPLMYVYFFYNAAMRLIMIFSEEVKEFENRIRISDQAGRDALDAYDNGELEVI